MTESTDRSSQYPTPAMGLVIFDLDGTLVDSMTVQARVFASYVHRYLPSVAAADAARIYRQTAGAPLAEQFLAVAPTLSRQEALDLSADFFVDIQGIAFAPFQDAAPCLTELKINGWRTAVSSGSSQASVDAKLATSGLSDLVDVAFGSDIDAGFVKGVPHTVRIITTTHLVVRRRISEGAYDVAWFRSWRCQSRIGPPLSG